MRNVTLGQIRGIKVNGDSDVDQAIHNTLVAHAAEGDGLILTVHQSIADLCQKNLPGPIPPASNGVAQSSFPMPSDSEILE